MTQTVVDELLRNMIGIFSRKGFVGMAHRKEIAEASQAAPDGIKPFSSSQVNQWLASPAKARLVYRIAYGQYAFPVPLMVDFVKRQNYSNEH